MVKKYEYRVGLETRRHVWDDEARFGARPVHPMVYPLVGKSHTEVRQTAGIRNPDNLKEKILLAASSVVVEGKNLGVEAAQDIEVYPISVG
jgi:hypothetical protein